MEEETRNKPNLPPPWSEDVLRRRETLRLKLVQIFENHPAVVLEIGCGHGHYLSAYAQAHPDTYCLGIDLITKRIEKSKCNPSQTSTS